MKENYMKYTELGKTGLSVSRLGYGAMRLPMTKDGPDGLVDREKAIHLLHRAFDLGINYFDTARGYCNEDSQRAVGEALEDRRDKVVISTKNPCFGKNEKEWWINLENSLKRLRTDYLDIYNFHGISWKIYKENIERRIGAWMRKAYDQGLVRHICCSMHDRNDALVKMVDTGMFESITLQYNLIDRSLEKGMAHAREKGVGIVVMGPVGGGRLAEPSEVMQDVAGGSVRIPELALRFVLSNPNVNVALSGMSTIEQLEENVKIADAGDTLPEDYMAEIKRRLVDLRKMADLYCTGCGYCLPCPQDVNIPRIFQLLNQGRIYGIWESARQAYADLGEAAWETGEKATKCIECGLCEPKCPQHIMIRDQLKDAHAILSEN